MSHRGFTKEEVARRGREIYEREIHSHVAAEHHGRVLVLDILTGDYEIADDDLTATDRLLARQPDAVMYGLRIGFNAIYSLGGRIREVGAP